MSLPLPPLSAAALWALAGIGALAAMQLLVPTERRARNRRRAAALGWSPARLAMLAVSVAVAVLAVGLVMGRQLADGASAPPQAVLAWAMLVSVAAGWAVPSLLVAVLLSGHRRRLDGAVLLWLRRIRLFVSAGRPISVAVLDAAERVADPSFAPAAGAVNAAVIGGRDPLSAVASLLADSPTAVLLRTVDAAERSGAAASQLLDRVLDRVVRSIDDRRRAAIDRLGRSVGTAASLLAVLASAVVLVTIVATLPTV